MSKQLRLALAIFALAISIFLLIWGYLPNPRETRVRDISPSVMQISGGLAIHESRRLILEFPPKMFVGEGGVITMKLVNIPMGEMMQFPDLYETHNVTAEAELDLAGFIVQPPNVVYEPLKRGGSVTFYWSIRPLEAGKYSGTVWLHLGAQNRLTGEKERVALSAQAIEVEALNSPRRLISLARAVGVIALIIALIIGLPLLAEGLFKRREIYDEYHPKN